MNKAKLLMPDSGQVRLVNNGSSYTDGSCTLNRVSQILSTIPADGLDMWKRRVGEEEANRILWETNRIGTLIHRVTEYHDLGMEEELDALLHSDNWLIAHWLCWWDWVDENVERILAVERAIRHPTLPIAGTLDRLLLMKGDQYPAIVDIKSSDYVSEKHRVQINGYRDMYNGCVDIWNHDHPFDTVSKVDRCIIVNLPRVRPGERTVRDVGSTKDTDRWRKAVIDFMEMR